MDLATVIGIAAGIILLGSSLLSSGNLMLYVNIPSVFIVVGGMIASTLINFPLGDVLGVFKTVKNAFLHKAVPPTKIIETIVAFAMTARREGILALESQASKAGDEFLERSIQLAVDGTAPELIKDILTTELAFIEERHSLGQSILTWMGTYAPAYGMIGTLIGLIAMLAQMKDPSLIGSGMAVAIITTFYGAVLANLVFLPLAGKLKVRTRLEILTKEIVIEGILSIQSGDNPRVVEQKLKAFIAPNLRELVETGRK